jgi:hypothetical protein
MSLEQCGDGGKARATRSEKHRKNLMADKIKRVAAPFGGLDTSVI